MSACSAIATFFAARNRPRISIDSDTSSINTVALRDSCSVRSISKSSGIMRTGRARTLTRDRVLERAPDVEMERVAVLVGLVLVGALVPEAGALDLVTTGAVLEQTLEEVAERALADAPDALRRELHATFALLDEPRVLELLGEVRELLQRAGRVVAEQVAHLVEVDLGERTGARRVAQEVLERVDVAELVEETAHAVERERLVAAETHALAPAGLRERVAQVLTELVDLPAQVHVVEERVRPSPAAGRAARATSS